LDEEARRIREYREFLQRKREAEKDEDERKQFMKKYFIAP